MPVGNTGELQQSVGYSDLSWMKIPLDVRENWGLLLGDAVKEDGFHVYIKRPGLSPRIHTCKARKELGPKTPFTEPLMEGAGLWLRLDGHSSLAEDKF